MVLRRHWTARNIYVDIPSGRSVHPAMIRECIEDIPVVKMYNSR